MPTLKVLREKEKLGISGNNHLEVSPPGGFTRDEKIKIAADLFSEPIRQRISEENGAEPLSSLGEQAVAVATFARMLDEGRRFLCVAPTTRPQAIETGIIFAALNEEAGRLYTCLVDGLPNVNGELNRVLLRVEKIRDYFTQGTKPLGRR